MTYRVEVEYRGCEECGTGASYRVVGPDDCAQSILFQDREGAEELADALSAAYSLGALGGESKPKRPPEGTKELLASLKEMREACALAVRMLVIAGHSDEYIARLHELGITDGLGERAQQAIAKAEGKQ